MAKHSIQHIAVCFVRIFRVSCHANIGANIEAYVGAFMNQRRKLLVEDANKVNALAAFFILIRRSQPCIKRSLTNVAAAELISLNELFSHRCKIDVSTLKQRDGVTW